MARPSAFRLPDGLSLPGTSGRYADTPDVAALDVVGDLELVARVKPATWNVDQVFVGKWVASGNQRSYRLGTNPSGNLVLYVSPDGTSIPAATSSAVVPFAGGTAAWVCATRRLSDGRVQFFTCADQETEPTATEWTQLGTNQVLGAATNGYAGTAPVSVGAISAGTGAMVNGTIYRAIVRSGAVTAFDVDFTDDAQGWDAGDAAGATGVDATGKPVTLHGAGAVIAESLAPLGVTTLRMYDRLPEFYAEADEPLGWPLLRFVSLTADQASEIETLWERMYDGELGDPTLADAGWLPWLAQLVGVTLTPGMTEEERREAIQYATSGWQAGTKSAVAAAARTALTGTKHAEVYDHTTDVSAVGGATQWDVLIVTAAPETPDVGAVLAAIVEKGAKPAGVKLYHRAYSISWTALESTYPTWNAIEALGSWQALENTGL